MQPISLKEIIDIGCNN